MNYKAGARHSAADVADMQTLHEIAVRQGAVCGAMKRAQTVVKSNNGIVRGYLIKFGGPDLEGDIFTKSTRLGVRDGQTLPLYWHHGLDPDVGKQPIGAGAVKFTAEGLWFEGWLTLRSKYLAFIKRLAEAGYLGFSSGADGNGVIRQPIPGKTLEYVLKAWPITEASLTPTPAAGPSATMATLKTMLGTDPRRPRIERELKMLEEDHMLDIELDLDRLEWQIRIERDLDILERGLRR